jgi:hypothetical protein
MGWSGNGVIELAQEGRTYTLKRSSMWKSDWKLRRKEGTIIFTIIPEFTGKTVGADLNLETEAISTERELSLLVIIAWYTILLLAYDTDEATAAGSMAAMGV